MENKTLKPILISCCAGLAPAITCGCFAFAGKYAPLWVIILAQVTVHTSLTILLKQKHLFERKGMIKESIYWAIIPPLIVCAIHQDVNSLLQYAVYYTTIQTVMNGGAMWIFLKGRKSLYHHS